MKRTFDVLVFASLALATSFLPGCPDLSPPERPTAELQANGRACRAKGEVLIAKSQMERLPCHTIELLLRNFVDKDEDCRAYYGDRDAGVSTALCGTPDAGRTNDGGLDGGD